MAKSTYEKNYEEDLQGGKESWLWRDASCHKMWSLTLQYRVMVLGKNVDLRR